jgi:toxin ParE1/3/4
MAQYDFTAQAVKDLREIGRYTKKTWGIEQARHYRQELELAIQKLSLNPHMGRERNEIAPGVRSFRVAPHIAFYAPRRDGLTVLRLLHPQMDVDLAFGLDPNKPDEHE